MLTTLVPPMSRAARLLDLIQLFRSHRYPVSAAILARKMGVSLRTLYRDIRTLQAQGAEIKGEAGVGYVLRPGFLLPPLMFSPEEMEALVLGSRWVASRADDRLGLAAKMALAKISAVLPAPASHDVESTGLVVGPSENAAVERNTFTAMRHAIRTELVAVFRYRDGSGTPSRRTVWPIALAFFDHVQILVAWCVRRRSFRHFRTDRISHFAMSDQRYARRRRLLLQEWRNQNGVPAP